MKINGPLKESEIIYDGHNYKIPEGILRGAKSINNSSKFSFKYKQLEVFEVIDTSKYDI